MVAISTRALSSFTTGLSDPPRSVSFLLYGHDRVLAHPFMTDGASRQSVASPLPTLESFGDPVIANLFRSPPLDEVGLTSLAGVLAREPSVDGQHYFVFARQIEGYGDQPITVGTYFLKHAVDAPCGCSTGRPFSRLFMFGISLIAAAVMAAAIARPIRRAATGATAIGNLDFDQVAPLSGSRFREINSLARSFNAMLDGLRAFGRYVPRTLVMRLVKEGRIGAGTEERVLAIMFTDIVGFTAACEKMSAGEVAAFINQHLTLVSACVEQEGGTIDKFIGDAVMAFWGAPGYTENPAASACRAAIAIQRALAADNAQRIARGLAPVRIRIGIHMGPVVVGDIGAPNRINYTIVGDAVNANSETGEPRQDRGARRRSDHPGQPGDFRGAAFRLSTHQSGQTSRQRQGGRPRRVPARRRVGSEHKPGSRRLNRRTRVRNRRPLPDDEQLRREPGGNDSGLLAFDLGDANRTNQAADLATRHAHLPGPVHEPRPLGV